MSGNYELVLYSLYDMVLWEQWSLEFWRAVKALVMIKLKSQECVKIKQIRIWRKGGVGRGSEECLGNTLWEWQELRGMYTIEGLRELGVVSAHAQSSVGARRETREENRFPIFPVRREMEQLT